MIELKINGDKGSPCLTPLLIAIGTSFVPCLMIVCLCEYELLTSLTNGSGSPFLLRASEIASCGIVSNAFEISRNTGAMLLLALACLIISLSMCILWKQPGSLMNPFCLGINLIRVVILP